MKHAFCQKCHDNQHKAGEALGLFNEASAELLDNLALLVQAERRLTNFGECGEMEHEEDQALLAKLRAAIATAGERKAVENGVREIIKPT